MRGVVQVHMMLATVLAFGSGRGWKAGSLQHNVHGIHFISEYSGTSDNEPEHNTMSKDVQYPLCGVPAG